MFELPAGISFIIDALILLLYFNSSWISNNHLNINIHDLNPLYSIFIFVLLAGLRIIAFLPYVWLYQHDHRLVLAQVPYLWHSFNFLLLIIKSCWELSHQSWDIYVWYILLGSTISIFLQTICLRHLISTALPERHVILGITRNTRNDLNNQNNHMSNISNQSNNENNNENNDDDNDIIQAIRISIQDVRQEWNRKIEKLANTFSELKISSGFGENIQGETIVFEQLLILFTQSQSQPQPQPKLLISSTSSFSQSSPDIVISNLTKLYYSYPNIVEFYIPQLLVFLLYGSFDVTSLLQNALFEMCENSITFSHKLHWFIVAFCLSGAGVGPEGVTILHHLLKQIESHGIISTQKFMQISSSSSLTTSITPSTSIMPSSTFLEKDQQHYQSQKRNSFERHDIGEGEEKLALLNSEYGSNKSSSLLSSAYFKSILLEKCVQLPNNLNDFTSTIAFWESLCDLSLHLGSLPRETRTDQMRINLHPIKEKYLPSLTIYSPVSGNISHRIWGIEIEESFAFSTKERAPMLLCLEIIEFYDYHQPINQRSLDKSGSSWLDDIKDGIKRAFLPQNEESKLSIVEHDIENGHHENEILGESSDSSYVKSGGSFQQPLTFLSDVGQWSEISPIKLKTRASFDSYYTYNKNNTISPRKSLGIPLRSGQSEYKNNQNNNQNNSSNNETKININNNVVMNQLSENNNNSNNNRIRSINVSMDDDPGVGTDKYGNADPIVVFKERWSEKEKRIRKNSPIGHLPGYKLVPVIVKSNDDLRQEQCAGQLIFQMNQILISGKIDCWLKPYTILALSPTSGLLEAIPDTISFDVLRRRMTEYTTLKNFFESFFGEEETESYEIARNNFIKSLSAYCIVCYLLQIKDRHNGNILLDRFGHIIHIDFGFILGSTPGGNIGFESAPFKLTAEMVELMGGVRSQYFHKFRDLCVKVYMELRKYHHKIVLLLEMLSVGNEHLPFFLGNPQRTIDQLRKRFRPEVHDQAAIDHVHHLINLATDNWTTTCYDRYQRCCVGVL